MALKTLYQILVGHDPSQLRVLARQWAITLKAPRKSDMAAELLAGMATDEAVSRVLEQLTPEQHEALDDILRAGGSYPWTVFVRRWGAVRTIGAGRLEREELWHEPQSSAEALWFLGLVQRAFTEDVARPVEMAFVPEELMLYMPSPPPVTIPPPEEVQAPPHSSAAADLLAEDLVSLWAALQQGDLPEEELLATLHPPAELRRTFLETLSLEQGWMNSRDRSLRADAIVRWLRSDPWTQASSLFEAWRASREWQDVTHILTLRPDPVKGWPTLPEGTRRAFLQTLAQCRLGAWYRIAAFTGYVKIHATDFLRPDGDYDAWAPRSTATEAPLRGFEAWDAVEGALVAYLITRPLYWLGAIRTGGPDVDLLDVFALTEAGAAWLGAAAPPDLPAPPPVVIENDGQITVPVRRRYERFQLSRIADLVHTPASGVDVESLADAQAYIFRLSPSSLSRARQQRISYDRIVAFLQEAAGGHALPDHLKTAIQRGYEQERGASLTRVWLLKVAEPRHLSLPGVAALIKTRLSPEWAVVADEHRDRLIALLAEHGVLVEIDGT